MEEVRIIRLIPLETVKYPTLLHLNVSLYFNIVLF